MECVFLVVCICAFSIAVTESTVSKEKILFLLVDGLRWDHFGYEAPSLDKMSESGVRAEWLDGVFPTRSAPSMFSIATGLYVESHGVVHNLAFNASTHEITSGWSETMDSAWWFNCAGEPLWITATLQGLRTGSFMYPGGQTPIDDIYPDKYVPYSTETYPELLSRASTVLDWLYEDGIDVAFLYIGELDTAHHDTGIGGRESLRLMGDVDNLINYILARMAADATITDSLNFIVASDHGMAEIDMADQALSLYDFVDEAKIDFVVCDGGSIFQIKPVDNALEEVFGILQNAHPSMYVFKKEHFPARFHYSNSKRNLPIMGYMAPGWTLYMRFNQSDAHPSAGHGYDNDDMRMKSSFYALGPSFKKGYRADHFESVNIYPLMCEILDIVPAPNNGSRRHYVDMLSSEPTTAPPGSGATALNAPFSTIVGKLLNILAYFGK